MASSATACLPDPKLHALEPTPTVLALLGIESGRAPASNAALCPGSEPIHGRVLPGLYTIACLPNSSLQPKPHTSEEFERGFMQLMSTFLCMMRAMWPVERIGD